jgi:RND superfamily putative drug exporter
MLRLLTTVSDVSIFAINIVTFPRPGLAIDYALFIVSRFPRGAAPRRAGRQGARAHDADRGPHRRLLGRDRGRVPGFLLFFPQNFLRSMGFGGMAAVLVAMVAALTVCRRCSRCSATG